MDTKKNFDPAEAETGKLSEDKLQQVYGGFDSPTIDDETGEEKEQKKKRPPIINPDNVPYFQPDYRIKL